MKVEWIGALQGASCIKLDDDMSSVVRFTMDAGQMPQVVKLVLFKGKRIKITVQEAE